VLQQQQYPHSQQLLPHRLQPQFKTLVKNTINQMDKYKRTQKLDAKTLASQKQSK
jgi:hypothetical protein